MGHRHEPPANGLGKEAPQGLEMGAGTVQCSHSSPGSLLWALHQSCHPLSSPAFSCPPLQTLPFHPHSAIVPPPDLFHLCSPAGPQLLPFPLLSLFLTPTPPPLASPSEPLHPSLLSCPSLPCLIPGSPSDPLLSDSARPGWGQGWDQAPQLPPSPPLFV